VNERTEAVLLTGLFGVGKSTIAADMANLLETSGTAYAALDLDWLTWTNAGGPTRADEHRTMLTNLVAIVRNYADVGVTRFVLARSIRDRHEHESLAAAMAMPLRTVELSLPYDELARRLATDPTDERQDDLAHSREWLTEDLGTGLADLTIANDRAVRAVSIEIITWLGWLPRPDAAQP
jgi:hypothetical protein